MHKFLSILQLILSAILAIAAVAMVVNLIFIIPRPETISVVNALIGGAVVIICFIALSRILFKKGWAGLTSAEDISQRD